MSGTTQLSLLTPAPSEEVAGNIHPYYTSLAICVIDTNQFSTDHDSQVFAYIPWMNAQPARQHTPCESPERTPEERCQVAA